MARSLKKGPFVDLHLIKKVDAARSGNDKNSIIEALKYKDINNIDNNKLISINTYDRLIKYRQFY